MANGWYLYLVFIILVSLSSFFSSAETALTSLNVIRIKTLVKNNKKLNRKAKIIFRLFRNYNATLTTILIGNTVVNIVLGVLSKNIFDSIFGFSKLNTVLISTLIVTLIVLVFGEIVPKSLAKIYPERVALAYSYVLWMLNFLFFPLTLFVNLFRIKNNSPTSSEQELIELVKIIESEGVLEKAERDLIESAITFDEKAVYEAMQPRHQVRYIFNNATLNEIKDIYIKEQYSRIPVLHNISGEVIGVLNVKDYIAKLLNNEKASLEDLMAPPVYLSKRTRLNNALEILQSERTHIAIVYSNKEKKDFSGIITLEDILEELVGEIYDETDRIGLVQEVGTHKFLVAGDVNLKIFFNRYLKRKAPAKKEKLTIKEWYFEKMKVKKITKFNPTLKFSNFVFTVAKSKWKQKLVFQVEILSKKVKVIKKRKRS